MLPPPPLPPPLPPPPQAPRVYLRASACPLLPAQTYWEEQAATVKAACSLSSFYGEVSLCRAAGAAADRERKLSLPDQPSTALSAATGFLHGRSGAEHPDGQHRGRLLCAVRRQPQLRQARFFRV